MILASGGKVAIDLSPQQVTSCVQDKGEYGCLGCNGGFTEGAYEYLKTETNKGLGLANSFYIPYQQSLTQAVRLRLWRGSPPASAVPLLAPSSSPADAQLGGAVQAALNAGAANRLGVV